MSLDQLFSATVLDVLVPNSSLDFPENISADEWLAKAQTFGVERRQAFFDEQLQSLLVLRIKHPALDSPKDSEHPPQVLLDLLAHVQVSLEATYISTLPTATDTPRTSRLLGTPRSSLARPSGRLNPHPSILPPSTPNPMPSTGDQDRKYTTAEGTMLVASIWGSNTSDDSPEAFSLLWSTGEECWIAIYCMAVTVSFLRLHFNDPLLCLTVSATLREKPIPTTAQHPLAKFLASIGQVPPDSPGDLSANETKDDEDILFLDGLEEVNLLEGLLAGTTFGGLESSELNLPSHRLGTVSRQKLFSLPPILADTPVQASPSPMTAVRKAHPTLRKSYRKTLQAASGFRVRMRTVFVPYVLLPETEGTVDDLDEEEKERERREAGSEERTVVLCVEIENSGDLGLNAGFMVEKVDVSIGGEGAKATLIGWGDHGFSADAAKTTFPLKIGPLAQYNLLYAVTFMRSPEEIDAFSFARGANGNVVSQDLQRAVTINVFGKPYFPALGSSLSKTLMADPATLSYPTRTFSSRWNCVLDLAAQQGHPTDLLDPNDPSGGYPSIMPEPASPFPVFSIYSGNTGTPGQYSAGSTPQYSATAGSKRFTLLPGANFAGRTLKNLTPNRSYLKPGDGRRDSTPMSSARLSSQFVASAPSSAAQYLRSPTTYSAPPPPPMGMVTQPPAPLALESDDGYATSSGTQTGMDVPPTPAYPAFPPKSALPPTPMSQGPIASSGQGNVGLSVEIRRERGQGVDSGIGALPQTPLPYVSGAFGEQRMLSRLQDAATSGESIVVSVGLLPLPDHDVDVGLDEEGGRGTRRKEVALGPGKIYPLSVFTLDIFVLNQSLWPRRFEVTCPERRRRRRGVAETGVYDGGGETSKKMGYPGVLPMDSRVRIGPLRPSACQSVRMNFLAVSPGVHSIDTLTLTDIESGFSMNLRSVLDVVVHDPAD
ncbi:TRAPP trafficking subunit Trs65-domain-containing protein [Crassisporium funariophilum]|nr:TRAPP trafficking subunit Trs65-domain-containing protein [Crassisporium funariophilum]